MEVATITLTSAVVVELQMTTVWSGLIAILAATTTAVVAADANSLGPSVLTGELHTIQRSAIIQVAHTFPVSNTNRFALDWSLEMSFF